MDTTALFRKAILGATQNRLVKSMVSRYGMRLGARRFVAGETLAECIATLKHLEAQGLYTNTTLLGEHAQDKDTTRETVAQYLEILDNIAREGLKTSIALKLTHLGLDLGEALALDNAKRIALHARSLGNFVCIDMEESNRVDATLRIYRTLREQGLANVGTVLQAYLYRSERDLAALLPIKPYLRLVKGAYLEPPEVAFPAKRDVDAAFVKLIERSLLGEGYTAVATHDDKVIDHTIAFAEQHSIPRERFEFQMLYGVRSQYQLELVRLGYKVLVATPYGKEWYPFLMRRLAERPANVLFIAKNLVGRKRA
jgi:proline dehydrogenase